MYLSESSLSAHVRYPMVRRIHMFHREEVGAAKRPWCVQPAAGRSSHNERRRVIGRGGAACAVIAGLRCTLQGVPAQRRELEPVNHEARRPGFPRTRGATRGVYQPHWASQPGPYAPPAPRLLTTHQSVVSLKLEQTYRTFLASGSGASSRAPFHGDPLRLSLSGGIV